MGPPCQPVRSILGESAINQEKAEVEGETSTQCLAWGLELDTLENVFRLPDLKWQKAQFILNQPVFDWGCRRATRHELQILRGNATYWMIVCPALRTEVASIDRLLSGDQEG